MMGVVWGIQRVWNLPGSGGRKAGPDKTRFKIETQAASFLTAEVNIASSWGDI